MHVRHKHALDIATAAGGARRYEGRHWAEALQGRPTRAEAAVTAACEVMRHRGHSPLERSPARCPDLRCCWTPWPAPASARCVPGRLTGQGTCTAARRQQPPAVHPPLGTAAPPAAELLLPQVSVAASKVREGLYTEGLIWQVGPAKIHHRSAETATHLLGRHCGLHCDMLPLLSCQTCGHRWGCSLSARHCCAAC